MESEDQIRSEEVRDWLELPLDTLFLILLKLSPVEDVLFGAQRVCSSWRKVSKDPRLWRSIDMRAISNSVEDGVDLLEVAKLAVDRSCGQLIEFSIGGFGRDEILEYITGRSPLLKCLRLESCIYITNDGMIEAVKKLPLLEELDLSYCQFSTKVIEAVGQHCPLLKSFKLNCRDGFRRIYKGYNEEAFAIAENMPGLCYLQLFRNKLTKIGLMAILGGCPNLESLDLRQCFHSDSEDYLLGSCADRIKFLKLPNDPVEENEFDAGTDSDESFVGDYPYGYHGGGTGLEPYVGHGGRGRFNCDVCH